MENVKRFMSFLEKTPSKFHTVSEMCKELRHSNYQELKENEKWQLKAGGRYYVVRNGSSLIAFAIPESGLAPFRVVMAHVDSPCFKLKPYFEDTHEKAYVRLNVAKYGGLMINTWLDRPLSVAGRLIVRGSDEPEIKLANINRDAVLIPNLAIHLNHDVNKGYQYNLQKDMMPLYGDENAKGGIVRELADSAGVQVKDVIDADLYLYSRSPASVWGADNAYFSCGRIDDMECAYAGMRAALCCKAAKATAVLGVFDNEETGSDSRQGAGSNFMYDVLVRIGVSFGLSECEIMSVLADGKAISADNAHALHPNFPEKFDSDNFVFMNKGIVIKHTADSRYVTDALSSGWFTMLCEKAGVPVQHFAERSDLTGGSTLGKTIVTKMSMSMVDIGLAQLAMHSAYETAGTADLTYLIKAFAKFWE